MILVAYLKIKSVQRFVKEDYIILQDSQNNSKFWNTDHALHQIGLEYSFTEYYRGLSGVVFRNRPSNIIFFSAREKVKDVLSRPSPRRYISASYGFLWPILGNIYERFHNKAKRSSEDFLH